MIYLLILCYKLVSYAAVNTSFINLDTYRLTQDWVHALIFFC